MKRSRQDFLKKGILCTINEDLSKVEDQLMNLVHSDNHLLYKIALQLLDSGGKRLRPALVLLSGRFFHYQLERVLPVAAAMELVHMATLVHDDIIDEAVKRRGVATVNQRYGDKVAVLNGDLLFAHGVKYLSSLPDRDILPEMLEVILDMCKGEVDEVTSNGETSMDIPQYLQRIKRKTALMFSKSCEFGARVCGASKEESKGLADYGINLGLAFQIMDDLKDLTHKEEELGKSPGEDLRQGIMTLPILLALENSWEKDFILEVLQTPNPDEILVNRALECIAESKAVEETIFLVKGYRDRSIQLLKAFPPIPERRSLELLADFIIDGYNWRYSLSP